MQGEVSFGLTQHLFHLRSVQLGIAVRNSPELAVFYVLFIILTEKIDVPEEGCAGTWTWEPKVQMQIASGIYICFFPFFS